MVLKIFSKKIFGGQEYEELKDYFDDFFKGKNTDVFKQGKSENSAIQIHLSIFKFFILKYLFSLSKAQNRNQRKRYIERSNQEFPGLMDSI